MAHKLVAFLSSLLLAAAIAASGSPAFAFVLTMDGANGVRVQTAAALYASSGDGLKKIVEAGALTTAGEKITDLGTPAMTNDGTVFFGALVQTEDKGYWRILRADAKGGGKITSAIEDKAVSDDCRPVITSDPRVAVGGNGLIAFVANDRTGNSELFRYVRGHLDCELGTGQATGQGHLVANLGFGSPQVVEDGSVALRATLALSPQAALRHDVKNAILLLTPGRKAQEVAVEGEPAGGGQRYGSEFGLPVLSAAGGALFVAFTNRDSHGWSLFVGRPAAPVRAIGTGAQTTAGAITYLSNGRPSLAADGSVAVEATSGSRAFILGVRAGEPRVVAMEGDGIGKNRRIIGLADPAWMDASTLFTEVADEEARNRIYSFAVAGSRDGISARPQVISGDVEVFPLSLAVNRSGQYAFLALPARSDAVIREDAGTSL